MKMLTKAICLPLVICLCPVSAQAKDEKAWATASDIGVAGLTIAALGVPIAKGDKQGAFQAFGSIGASALVTTGLKETFPELRPDGPRLSAALSLLPSARLMRTAGMVIDGSTPPRLPAAVSFLVWGRRFRRAPCLPDIRLIFTLDAPADPGVQRESSSCKS